MICDWASGLSDENLVVWKQSQPLDISEMLLAVCEKGRVSEVGLFSRWTATGSFVSAVVVSLLVSEKC